MAEEAETQVEDTEAEDQSSAQTETETQDTQQNQPSKADEVVAKLQKRIGKEQAEKNDFKSKYEDALKQIDALQKGDDPTKEPEPTDDQKQISKLQAQIARRDMRDQARTVISDAGFNVPNDLLEALVVDDDKQTLANVKAVIEYTNAVQDGIREEFRKGKTPRTTGKVAKAVTKEVFDKMTPTEKLSLGVKEPDLYAKLINE